MTAQEQRAQLEAALAAIDTAANAVATATKTLRALPKQYGMTLALDALESAWSELRWACEYANKLPIREFWLKVQEMTGERIEVDSGLGESYTVEIEVDA